jgi:hypothetical protein
MTKLFLHGVLAGKQAQLGTVKAGTEQFVDCILKILRAFENANCFADDAGLLFNQHCDSLPNWWAYVGLGSA